MGKDRKAPEEPASEFNIGSRKKGLDGEWWVVHKTASGIKRWNRYITKAAQAQKQQETSTTKMTKVKKTTTSTAATPSASKLTAKEPTNTKTVTISRFDKEKAEQSGEGFDIKGFERQFKKAADDMRKQGVYSRIKPAGKDLDTAMKNVCKEMAEHKTWDPELTPFVFFTENALLRARNSGLLYLTFRLPSKKSKLIVRQVLGTHFKGQCEWDGTDHTKIIVRMGE